MNSGMESLSKPEMIPSKFPASIPDQPAGGDYGYDWVGNRLNPPSGANPMVYDAADRLIWWPGMYGSDNRTANPDDDIDGFVYYYDGSLKEKFHAKSPVADLVSSYTYTPDGLLSSATYAGRTSTFTWDADKNRVGMTMNGGNYSFVYDTTAGIPAVIEEVTPAGSIFYIREPGGELLARMEGSDIRYYHFDELGSTRLLTDGTGDAQSNPNFGKVTDRYVYDAYGNTLSHTGSTDQPYQYVGRLGYYTHHQDPEFALMQLGVRFYDPETERFISRDPIRNQESSSYIYVDLKPLMLIDSWGLEPQDIKSDFALNKCLGRIRKCFPCMGSIINKVNRWYVGNVGSAGLITWEAVETGEVTKVRCSCGMHTIDMPVVDWRANIGFDPDNAAWKYRNGPHPTDFHRFCMTVYHELRHASTGMCGTFTQGCKDILNPDSFTDQTDLEYRRKANCMTNGGGTGDLPR